MLKLNIVDINNCKSSFAKNKIKYYIIIIFDWYEKII